MKKTTTTVKTEEKFSDHLDAIKETMQVHEKGHGIVLSKNHVLADYGNEREKYTTFIIREMIAAKMIRQYIADKHTAEELATLIETESEAHAILHRNIKTNPMVIGIIDRQKTEEAIAKEQEEKKENGILRRLRGSVKPKDEKEPEKE